MQYVLAEYRLWRSSKNCAIIAPHVLRTAPSTMSSTTDLLNSISESEQAGVQALTVEELRRLHEGVLARYSLRPSEYTAWKAISGH